MAKRREDMTGREKFTWLFTADHRFVFLGTSLVGVLAIWLSCAREPLSFAQASPLMSVLRAIVAAWWVASLVPGIYKLTHWASYAKSAPFVKPAAKRAIRLLSYIVWAAEFAIAFITVVVGFISDWQIATSLTENPSDFVQSAIYMIYNQKGIMLRGLTTTCELALFSTIIAFVVALLLVFLRMQAIDRMDNYFLRFWKVVGRDFALLYSTIIRGTPMMVQGLVIYYTGFSLFRSTGMDINQVQSVWSFFVAGLVTLSVCSAAYMAEVLRASIEAVDPGQLEAARSLGLTQWQGMRSIVFPQGIRNAMPAISNELIINIKDSSVLSVIGVFDLMYSTTSITGIYYRQMEVYIATALIYLCLTYVASKILSWISKRRGMDTRNIMSTDNTVAIGEMLAND